MKLVIGITLSLLGIVLIVLKEQLGAMSMLLNLALSILGGMFIGRFIAYLHD